MNYYERHLGDYAKDTAHLSMLEHGAYGLLLDRYYATEQGIPADQAHRVARARSKEEKQAVDDVLREFFILKDGVWTKGRVEEEIVKAQTKIKAAQENGKRGGRPKKNPTETEDKPGGLLVGSENETQSKAHQTPDTSHQSINPVLDTQKQDSEIHGSVCAEPTKAGIACKTMREAGIQDGNPSHPTLLALLDAGATEAEFRDAAATAVAKGKPSFSYTVGIVKKQREDAAKLVLHNGPLPNARASPADARKKVAQAIWGNQEGEDHGSRIIDISAEQCNSDQGNRPAISAV